jgi:type I restriction enzyme S subunit
MMQHDSISVLPTTWATITIGDVYDVVGGGTPSTSIPEYWGGSIAWITSADIAGVRDIKARRYVTDKGIRDSATTKVPARTLLVVTRVGLGKIAIAQQPICFSQDIQGLVQDPNLIIPEYALHFLSFALQRLKFEGRGTTISGLTKKQLKDVVFPLPPLNEQLRIVTKIEELLSELDNGIQNLRKVQGQLQVYRQAILKHAFTGKMTGQWRDENRTKLEPADQLLIRVKKIREAQYQKQLKKWSALAARSEKDSKPRPPSYAEPFSDEEKQKLARLPDTWRWAKFGELFGVYVGATPSRKTFRYWGGSIHWVSSGEVRFQRLRSTRENISLEGLGNTSTECHPPGTVMLAMIGEGKTRGQAAILEIKACHNQNTAAIRVSETDCVPEYVYCYLFFQYQITRTLGSGNNQKALNKERVSNMCFPLAPVVEQREIVARIETRISVIEKMEKDIELEIDRAEALRHSILKKAFSGKLVAQSPPDEPASILLERIGKEKAVKMNDKKKIKRRSAA